MYFHMSISKPQARCKGGSIDTQPVPLQLTETGGDTHTMPRDSNGLYYTVCGFNELKNEKKLSSILENRERTKNGESTWDLIMPRGTRKLRENLQISKTHPLIKLSG